MGAQAPFAPNYGAQEILCMQMTLHQGAHRAIADEGNAALSRCNRVRGLINSDMAQVSLERLSKGYNLRAMTNQDRGDEPQIPSL